MTKTIEKWIINAERLRQFFCRNLRRIFMSKKKNKASIYGDIPSSIAIEMFEAQKRIGRVPESIQLYSPKDGHVLIVGGTGSSKSSCLMVSNGLYSGRWIV